MNDPMPVRGRTPPLLFPNYKLDQAYDEMFTLDGLPRPQYELLFERLQELTPAELQERQQSADLSFLHQGITFTVYGDARGTERIFPYDLLPRIITATEWDRVEHGLLQRITALNLFLDDIYHGAKILADKVVPFDLVYSCKHYRREMRGLEVPHGVYVAVTGTDLVRLPDGQFAVLEDNLRVPSGASYMLANRQVMKRVFPNLFEHYRVRPLEFYGQALFTTLRELAPPHVEEPNIVLLTPGVYNSAYFEHTFLARQMGVLWWKGATWWRTTAVSTCARPPASSGWTSSTAASTTISSIRWSSARIPCWAQRGCSTPIAAAT